MSKAVVPSAAPSLLTVAILGYLPAIRYLNTQKNILALADRQQETGAFLPLAVGVGSVP